MALVGGDGSADVGGLRHPGLRHACLDRREKRSVSVLFGSFRSLTRLDDETERCFLVVVQVHETKCIRLLHPLAAAWVFASSPTWRIHSALLTLLSEIGRSQDGDR